MRFIFLFGLAALGVAGCGRVAPQTAPMSGPGPTLALGAQVTEPEARAGECWTAEITPAVIESVTEQRLVTPEALDANGSVIAPATYSMVTRQRMVRDRTEIWFPVPCPALQDVGFIATLQRALKARGYYVLPLTGVMDAATTEAVRRFQAERGLDSPVLSLAAAQELGLIAVALDDL